MRNKLSYNPASNTLMLRRLLCWHDARHSAVPLNWRNYMRDRAVPVISALVVATMAIAVPHAAEAETREIVAGPEYERSSLHNWWWGHNYRDVWLTPADIEVLDLQQEAETLLIGLRACSVLLVSN